MDILDRFFGEARQRRRCVVLPEGEDPRVVAAARRLKDEALAEPILLGQRPSNWRRRPARRASRATTFARSIRRVSHVRRVRGEPTSLGATSRRALRGGWSRSRCSTAA